MANKKNIRILVEALRSGEYIQGVGSLKQIINNKVYHCPLGVAEECRIKSVKYGGKFRLGDDYSYYIPGADMYLSAGGQKWLGINNTNPYLKIPEHLQHKAQSLAKGTIQLNDLYNFTFEEIADCFEHTFLEG